MCAETNSHIPYIATFEPTPVQLLQVSQEYRQYMEKRRSIRFFSDKAIPASVIENIIMTAASAPSGANKQPWTFCAINNPDLKTQIRIAAEAEEYRSYNGRMSEEWLQDLAVIGTDWQKSFLEIAPWLIVVFRRNYEIEANGHKHPNYYVQESVGIACGFLLAAIHQVGLVALTHTPSPMDFLTKILQRPANEKPFLLIPVGYPADDATVPNIERKTAQETLIWY